MKISTVLGTRPEIIKLSPILPLLDNVSDHSLIHTGQHYDFEMDKIFFSGLELRDPDFSLEVGSDGNAAQTAKIITELVSVLETTKPDVIVVQGDTNSALAGALAGAKSGIKVAHVEAGCRSFNRLMPEELNRILVDHAASILFAPFEDQADNLRREGVAEESIYVTGSTLTDICRDRYDVIDGSDILNRVGISASSYVLATIHRAENTNDPSILRHLIEALSRLGEKVDIVFPIHPRTRAALGLSGTSGISNLKIIDPLGYIDFLKLISDSRFVMTDSGGVQEEAAILNVPGLILREETEWMNYVKAGKNKLVGRDVNAIFDAATELLIDEKRLGEMRDADAMIPRGAGAEIVRILLAGS